MLRPLAMSGCKAENWRGGKQWNGLSENRMYRPEGILNVFTHDQAALDFQGCLFTDFI